MLLDLFAHEERLRAGAARERGACDGVRAHRHAADRRPAPRGYLRGEQLAERGEALGAQDRALGVDVIPGLGPARERHLADDERVLAQERHESRARLLTRTRMFVQGAHART